MLDILLQLLMDLFGALTDDELVSHVEVFVTRVNHLKLLFLGLDGGQIDFALSFVHGNLMGIGLSLADFKKSANWLILLGEIAVLVIA